MHAVRPFALVLGLLACGLFAVGCDAVISYTVVNLTGGPVLTRGVLENCDHGVRNRQDHLDEEPVASGETYEYTEIFGAIGPTMKCVHVLDANRRIVLAAPFREGATYTVTTENAPAGDPLLPRAELPNQSVGEFLGEVSPGVYVLWAFVGIPFVGGVAVAVFLMARGAWRTVGRRF